MSALRVVNNQLKAAASFVLGALSTMLVISFILLLLLKYFGPLHSKIVARFIEATFVKQIPDSKINIADAAVAIDDENRISFAMTDVSFELGNVLVFVPRISIVFDIMRLVTEGWRHSVASLVLSSDMVISAAGQHQDHGKKSATDYERFFARYFYSNLDFVSSLESILQGVQFKLRLPQNDEYVVIELSKLQFQSLKQDNDDLIEVLSEIKVNDLPIKIRCVLHNIKKETVSFNGSVGQFPTRLLLKEALFDNNDLRVDLEFKGVLDQFEIQEVQFHLSHHEGYIGKGRGLNKDIKFENIALSGDWKAGDADCAITLKNDDLTLHGLLSWSNQGARGRFSISKMPVSVFLDYWPNSVLTEVRSWIGSSIQSGFIEEVQLRFDWRRNPTSALSKDLFSAQIAISDIILRYMPEPVPVVRIKNGEVLVSEKDVDIKVREAYVKSTRIDNLRGVINYKEADPILKLSGKSTGSVQDVIDIGFNHADVDNSHLKNFVGTARTDLEMRIPLQKQFSIDEQNTIINVHTERMSNNALTDFISIEDAKLKATMRGSLLKIEGQGRCNKAFHTNFFISYDAFVKERVQLSATARSDIREMAGQEFSDNDWVKGSFTTNLDLDFFKNHYELKSSTDLSKLALSHPIGISKASGDASSLVLNLSGDIGDSSHRISLYDLNISGVRVFGAGFIDSHKGEVRLFSKDSSSEDEVGFRYHQSPQEGIALDIYGKKLDLSSIDVVKLLQIYQGRRGTNFKLRLDLANIILHEGQMVFDPKVDLQCDVRGCNRFQLSGAFYNGAKIEVFYSHPVIAIIADDAEKALSAFGIYRNLAGGRLEFKGKFNSKDMLRGYLMLEDYYLTNTSFWTSLVTAFSSLQNPSIANKQGIHFKSLASEVIYSNKRVYINQLSMVGPAFNIRGAGVINADLKVIGEGVIIPYSIINNAAQKLPIVKHILAGNKDNALIASNFSVYGDISSPKMIMNPLSIFAPGFLREIFDREKALREREDFPQDFDSN